MGKTKREVSPKLKFQVVLEALTDDKTLGQIAKAYNDAVDSQRWTLKG